MNLQDVLRAYEADPIPHKPLKIIHGFDYPEEAPIREKQAAIRQKLEELAGLGYGGVVTNVHSRHHYLQSPEEWQLLRYTFQTCREMGLRTWIYDEQGYPSGGAGGLTLEGHPERQAKGLAMLSGTFAPGQAISLPFPAGHTQVYGAFAYRAPSLEALTDQDLLHPLRTYPTGGCQGISDFNDTGVPVTAVLLCTKPMYEGTHAVHNVFESRRYIDVSDREAVAAFVRNTYLPYLETLAQDGPIEGVFTDEPSFMGAYINFGLYPPAVRDPYDPSIPLLPTVNWGADLPNRFQSRCGYPLLSRAVYLFCGHSPLARQTRMDFYGTLSALYEEAFFAQLADTCGRYGVPFSGHVLLEDDIRYHPVFEGNYFSLLRHMHIPGIDMLHGVPEKIREDAFTPKLVSSIAHTYGRPHVMSEISAHNQGGKVAPEQLLGTMYTQYALGVDVFHSYFSERQVEPALYQSYHNAVGRIDAVLGGGRHISGTAVYYPIETIQAGTLPYGEEIYRELDRNEDNTLCWHSLKAVMDTLLSHQLDFDFLDTEALEKARIGEGVFTAMGGEEFRALVIPACRMTRRLEGCIRQLEARNIPVFRLDSPLSQEEPDCGQRLLSSPEALPGQLSACLEPVLSLDSAPELLMLCRENQNGRSVLVVNTAARLVSARAAVRTLGERVQLYDPLENRVLSTENAQGFDLRVAPYGALLLLPEA